MIPFIATAATWLGAFRKECIILGFVAFIAGTGVSGYAAHKITRAFYRSEVAEAKLVASELSGSLDRARADAQVREDKIMADAKEQYDAQTSAINGVAGELRRLASGVQICASVSTMQMRVPESTTGLAEAVEGAVARRADVVLQELAAQFARRADDNATAYNSLMERWEKVHAGGPKLD